MTLHLNYTEHNITSYVEFLLHVALSVVAPPKLEPLNQQL